MPPLYVSTVDSGNCAAALAVVNGKDMGGAVLRRILLNNADGILAAMAYPDDPFRYLHDDAPLLHSEISFVFRAS